MHKTDRHLGISAGQK